MYYLLWQRLILGWEDYPDGHTKPLRLRRDRWIRARRGGFKTRIEDPSQRFEDAVILALNLEEHFRRLEV